MTTAELNESNQEEEEDDDEEGEYEESYDSHARTNHKSFGCLSFYIFVFLTFHINFLA